MIKVDLDENWHAVENNAAPVCGSRVTKTKTLELPEPLFLLGPPKNFLHRRFTGRNGNSQFARPGGPYLLTRRNPTPPDPCGPRAGSAWSDGRHRVGALDRGVSTPGSVGWGILCGTKQNCSTHPTPPTPRNRTKGDGRARVTRRPSTKKQPAKRFVVGRNDSTPSRQSSSVTSWKRSDGPRSSSVLPAVPSFFRYRNDRRWGDRVGRSRFLRSALCLFGRSKKTRGIMRRSTATDCPCRDGKTAHRPVQPMEERLRSRNFRRFVQIGIFLRVQFSPVTWSTYFN